MRYPSVLVLGVALLGCDASEPEESSEDGGTASEETDLAALPYATEVVSFEPGEGAGYGQDDLPEVVLGAPEGKGVSMGSLDVLSLGVGGEIVLAFGDRTLVDGPGADLVVFENAFFAGGDPTAPFAEPGEVAVSEDGERWMTFVCDPTEGPYPGCAGVTPTLEYDAVELVPIDPEQCGGDAFDLADVALARARFVRIRDLADEGTAPSAGFDLDAIGLVHYEE
jgi:hypothetical protein